MRTYLNVSFEEKEEAKSKGARWDVSRKKWYAENVEDLTPFLKWIDERLKKPSKIFDRKIPKKYKNNNHKSKSIAELNIIENDKKLDVLLKENESLFGERYLVMKNGEKNKAHILNGRDTVCRMLSTGGLKINSKKTMIVSEPTDAGICLLCQEKMNKYTREEYALYLETLK